MEVRTLPRVLISNPDKEFESSAATRRAKRTGGNASEGRTTRSRSTGSGATRSKVDRGTSGRMTPETNGTTKTKLHTRDAEVNQLFDSKEKAAIRDP